MSDVGKIARSIASLGNEGALRELALQIRPATKDQPFPLEFTKVIEARKAAGREIIVRTTIPSDEQFEAWKGQTMSTNQIELMTQRTSSRKSLQTVVNTLKVHQNV